ncbi:unnamed protein product [Auanema sp. JU1783]|nr:unnamed protein product [Auanema sp. JU1783]
MLWNEAVVFLTFSAFFIDASQITIPDPVPGELLDFQTNNEPAFNCPSDIEAVRNCKPYTLFTYTTCCLDDDTKCCFHMKEWVWIAGGALVALIGAIALTCLARCIFRFKNKSQQSYDFA